ncbi:MAG: hypothetical protein PHN44_06115 [Candidatus Marinimicrobia bacterium]|jgi:hypothetical protein|nr:hypothetical protein [Candidatus Neomarinimicrobiota bacterium]
MSTDNKHIAISVITTVLLIAVLLFAISCEKCPTEPELPEFRIDISADYVGATRVRLSVSISDSGEVREFGIKRNGEEVSRHQLSGSDTLITDVTANPATAYQYKGVIYYDGKEIDSSEVINLTTLDTTSHEVEWTIFRFGYIGSYLRDVFIVSEDDIWAVGFIETEETLHNDTLDPYNAVHWNGNEWELKRIPSTYKGSAYPTPLTSVYAFSSSDIWANTGFPKHGDGSNWTLYHLQDMGIQYSGVIEKCWGTSSDNMFFSGTKGCFIHYIGGNWIVINTNTHRSINDIYGLSANLIYMVSSDQDNWSSNFIIYEGGKIRNIDFPDTCMQAVYATAWNDVYLVGEGMLYYDGRKINDSPWPDELPMNLLQAVRGNGPNDIFLAGHMGTVIHYNGKTWQYYQDLFEANALYAISVKNDCIVAVGLGGQQGIIYHGVRK